MMDRIYKALYEFRGLSFLVRLVVLIAIAIWPLIEVRKTHSIEVSTMWMSVFFGWIVLNEVIRRMEQKGRNK